jgi:hypothetical protein
MRVTIDKCRRKERTRTDSWNELFVVGKDVQSVAVVFPRLELGLTAVRLNVQPTEQLLLPIICHYLAHLSDNLSGQSSS